MGPGELHDVMTALRRNGHPDLLVGLARRDDAAVYRIGDEVAIVETVDFFPPVVDDPYTYGAIAAANAMSDVYAMGGQVLFALNVAGFPRDFPREVIAQIFGGGADKVAEGGGGVAGGGPPGGGGAQARAPRGAGRPTSPASACGATGPRWWRHRGRGS